jgi:nucleotide-binding universal stress UspA family protein
MYERIVVALDGSVAAEQVIPHVTAIAERFGSQIILVRAISLSPIVSLGSVVVAPAGPGPLVDPTPTILNEELEATTYLEGVTSRLRDAGCSVEYVVREQAPADAIIDASEQADLIALTTHGRGGLIRVVLGSVAEDVLRRAERPVLVVRAADDSNES